MTPVQNNNFLNSIPPVTRNIIIINVIVWLATYVFRLRGIDLIDILGLHFFQASGFKPHQLITYMFLHDTSSPAHIFFNMFAVYMFGRVIELTWGAKKYLIYYTVTGIGAGIMQELVWLYSLQDILSPTIHAINTGSSIIDKSEFLNQIITIGASGAVFGILLAFGMLFPNASLYVMFIPIPIKAKYFVIFYGLAELFFGIANRSGDNVAHFAHLGGMLFGLILILYWRKKDKKNGQFYQ